MEPKLNATWRRMIPVLLACLLLLLPGGCARVPGGEPDLRGEITSIGRAVGSSAVQILVEARPGEEDGSDKAHVFVAGDRVVFRRVNGSHRGAATADLEEGQWVQVWFDGPVAESYPLQGKARAVVILPEAEVDPTLSSQPPVAIVPGQDRGR
ncbi:MAG: DUF3221 domain-containing protein [Bacillota bacterium]